MEPLILASASPQRAQLLKGLNIPFVVEVSQVNESVHQEADPVVRAKALAKMKAEEVASRFPNRHVLGCDTLVVSSQGNLLEKPTNAEDAVRMLRLHNGNTSVVHSTLCLITPKGIFEEIDSSKVTFNKLNEDDIRWWISTNLWKDRSGSFQIDGPGQLMIERIEGDWTGVVGLPVFLFGKMLREAGLTPFSA